MSEPVNVFAKNTPAQTEQARRLQAFAARVHAANAKWWVDLETNKRITRNVGELLMLVTSELSEAMEGHRKNLLDDHLSTRKMFEVELADAVIRLLDIAGGMNLTFQGRAAHYEFTDNTAENLLRIVEQLLKAYRDAAMSHLFVLRIETSIVMIQRLAHNEGLDLWSAFEEKMNYNAVRADHQHDARRQADGKKY